jgi:hypothetical protein
MMAGKLEELTQIYQQVDAMTALYIDIAYIARREMHFVCSCESVLSRQLVGVLDPVVEIFFETCSRNYI